MRDLPARKAAGIEDFRCLRVEEDPLLLVDEARAEFRPEGFEDRAG
jgi:hypothetical protein